MHRPNLEEIVMRYRRMAFAAALAAVSVCANAQSMKPGLWEINNNTQMGGTMDGQRDQQMAQMQQQMANLPAEQRKMMEDMMAKQGIKMGAGSSPGAMSVQVCVTKEMAEKNEIPSAQGDCKNTVSPRTGNSMKFSFSCTTPPASGEGQVTFVSPESYTMKMAVNTVVQGKPEKISMDGSGKWLAADCGSVKPMAMPK